MPKVDESCSSDSRQLRPIEREVRMTRRAIQRVRDNPDSGKAMSALMQLRAFVDGAISAIQVRR